MSDPRSAKLTAAVVGGGIGGLVTALELDTAGFDVRVYEQARAASEVGAGIQLAPNCTRVLRRLGLLPAVERVAVRPEAFEFRRWDDGRVLSSTTLGDEAEAAYGAPYLHIHRADLVALLMSATTGRVELGRHCTGVEADGDRVEVRFAEGAAVEAAVVVGADGIHSAVRRALLGDEGPRFTGNVAFRALVPAEAVAHLGLRRTCTVWLGPGGHLVHYYVAAGRLLNLVCVREEGTWTRESWTDQGDVEELRAAYRGWSPVVGALLDAVEVPLKWALFDREPLDRWCAGRVALLGDACHAMLPYLAQGAAQAIEDAAVLGANLAGAGRDEIPAALVRYEGQRHDRAATVQAMSRGNAERFHLPDGPAQRARDQAMAASFGLAPEVDWLYGTGPR